ncbi:MAG: Holliday junction branch migration protein RuvA [bacterium]|nr:Holliday junction branch migration protein RuvA [bacterium]
MIAGLRGKIQRFGAARVYLDVQGVEYEVHVPLSVQSVLQMQGIGSETSLRIYHHITDSDQRLFGFQAAAQREFFIALQTVKGLGTGLALSLMSHLEPAQFLDLCVRKDVKALCHIPRVGKATAETLVFEVSRRKDRWAKLLQAGDGSAESGAGRGKGKTALVIADLSEQEDLAMQALVQLGYKESEAAGAIEKLRKKGADADEDPSEWNASAWIERALRIL